MCNMIFMNGDADRNQRRSMRELKVTLVELELSLSENAPGTHLCVNVYKRWTL